MKEASGEGLEIGRRQPGVLVDFMLQHLPPDPWRGETEMDPL